MQTLFITGTDTGVGKTVVTAVLAEQFRREGKRVCVYKPIQTGSDDLAKPEDPEQIRAWLGDAENITFANTYNFHPPVTPWIADPMGTIHLDRIQADFETLRATHDVVLVEGAGGVMVPISATVLMVDLIRQLDIPVVLVARPNLGTINHTLLSVEALQRRQCDLLGVVVSNMPQATDDPAIQTLPMVFDRFLPVPVLAYLPPLQWNRPLSLPTIPLNGKSAAIC